RRLLKAFPSPKLRVIVSDDSVPFNREGKNVMCGFIIDTDEGLRPSDEVIIVDKNDDLVAIGRIILTKYEAEFFKKGLAIKTREGIKGPVTSA
ncbi:MAG: PUA domain-containing protein, partial [Methanomassiliicoccales archaeon]